MSNNRGFTIVELLIVIVVIAILAAISVVAYNGIQERAKNAQTTQALSSLVKGLNLYKSANSRWPSAWTCVGTGYMYGPTGTDTSGIGQCRQSNATTGVVEGTTLSTLLKDYINPLPTPAMVTARSTDTVWWRGIAYIYAGGGTGTEVYIETAFAGNIGTCPPVGGLSGTVGLVGGNSFCHYTLGSTSDT